MTALPCAGGTHTASGASGRAFRDTDHRKNGACDGECLTHSRANSRSDGWAPRDRRAGHLPATRVPEPLRPSPPVHRPLQGDDGGQPGRNPAEVLPPVPQEAKELVAGIRPVEKVPERTVVTVERTVGSAAEPRPTHPERVQIETPRTLVEPMTATLSRIHLTASRDFLALLEKAKAGQPHVQPAAHPRRLHLRRHGQARGGPHPTARPGRPLHGRQRPDPLQTPQPGSSAGPLRRRPDGQVHDDSPRTPRCLRTGDPGGLVPVPPASRPPPGTRSPPYPTEPTPPCCRSRLATGWRPARPATG